MLSAYKGTDIISYLRKQIYHTKYRISYRISDISLKNADGDITVDFLCV